jgi:low affinity Fe/Cu permease
MKDWFRRFASTTSDATGSWWAFMLAVLLIVGWLAAGFFVQGGFQNTFYQLIINTGTTIITFLMVFLIQNTQNRDAKAIHLKLDELLRAVEGARTSMANLENLPDEELKRIQEEFKRLCEERGIGDCEVEAIEDVLEDREAEKVELANR